MPIKRKLTLFSVFVAIFFVLHVSPGGLKVTCEYITQHEGVLCEEVRLLSETNDDVCVRVKVHARVMGKVVFNNIYVII